MIDGVILSCMILLAILGAVRAAMAEHESAPRRWLVIGGLVLALAAVIYTYSKGA